MQCFVVIAPPQSELSHDDIIREYPKLSHRVASNVWVVSSPDQYTTESVCKTLGIGNGDESDPKTGVVVALQDYNGYANRSLWETLRTWEAK